MTSKESHLPLTSADVEMGALDAPSEALGQFPDGMDAMTFNNEQAGNTFYDKLEPLGPMAPPRIPYEKPFRTAAGGHRQSTTRVKRALFKDVCPLKESNA